MNLYRSGLARSVHVTSWTTERSWGSSAVWSKIGYLPSFCSVRTYSGALLTSYCNCYRGAFTRDILPFVWNGSEFEVHVTVHRDEFLITKPTRCPNFSNLFLEGNSTCFGQFLCPPSGVFNYTHSTVICHTGLWQLTSRIRMEHSSILILLVSCMTYTTAVCAVKNSCPKHLEFHSKNKFEKLVHLVGFIMRNLSRCTVTWMSNL